MKPSYRIVPCCLLASALLAPASAQTQQIQVQGRKVLVHVPAGYDPARPAPLVLAFHGGGGSADFMADDSRYGLQRQADQGGFIVAFPNGASRLPGGRLATWNAGACCAYARDGNSDDVGFARAVVGAIEARYAVDTTTQCNPARPVSVLHIHARDDDHVLFAGGAGPGAFRDRHSVMEFVSVPQTIAGWVRRDQCVGSPQRVLQVPGAYCDVYENCAGGAQVQLCVTDTGGHSWPGADRVRAGKEAASTALDASATIWRFFAGQPARR
jgi:polyhydroxybutyrate depolymerase